MNFNNIANGYKDVEVKKNNENIIEPDELFSLKKSIVEVLTCIWLSKC